MCVSASVLLSPHGTSYMLCTCVRGNLDMASAAPSKRMVSSVFITLATPYRGTVTQQQQPTLKAHSSSVLDNHQAAVQISPTDTISKATQKKDNNLSSETNGIRPKGNDQTVTVASTQASDPQNPRVKPGPIRAKLPENKKHHNRGKFNSKSISVKYKCNIKLVFSITKQIFSLLLLLLLILCNLHVWEQPSLKKRHFRGHLQPKSPLWALWPQASSQFTAEKYADLALLHTPASPYQLTPLLR